jgi:Family of unknown function (DUF5317)
MILLLALALAVAWTILRGKRPANRRTVPFSGIVLVLVALVVQVAIIYLPVGQWVGTWARVGLFMFSYALLAVFTWLNRRSPGMLLIGVGLLANWLVMLVNGGHMPVTYEALAAAGRAGLVSSTVSGSFVSSSKDILLASAETRLWFLSDIFVMPRPFPLASVFSPGDVLMALGLFWLVPFALGAPTARSRASAQSKSI